MPDSSEPARTLVRAALERAGVRIVRDRAAAVSAGRMQLAAGDTVTADIVVWAAGAAAPPMLASTGLPVDGGGFLRTTAFLQSVGDPAIFAAGDCGSLDGATVPKAGVYAVRQGPVLLENLARALTGRPLTPYQPQPSFLKLLNAGDGTALGEWRGHACRGRWVRLLKDQIDRRFVARYRED